MRLARRYVSSSRFNDFIQFHGLMLSSGGVVYFDHFVDLSCDWDGYYFFISE